MSTIPNPPTNLDTATPASRDGIPERAHNDGHTDEPQQVDQAPDPRPTAFDRITAHREATKQPVVAEWVREREQRAPIMRWAAGYSGHIVLFHLLRLPLYQLKLVWRAPVGAYRVLRAIFDALTDTEGRPLRISAVERDDVREYLQLTKERNARIRHRGIAAGGFVFAVLVCGALVWWLAPGWAWWAFLAAGVNVLGVVGRDREMPLVSKATTPAHIAPPLRQDAVDVAVRALPGMKRDAVIEYPAPIMKDGPGWLATIRLPHGYTVSKVLGAKEELANGLRRPTGAVWPEGDDEDASILRLWVGFQAMGKMRQPAWPLLKAGRADFFTPAAYGTDKRGRIVKIGLFENNVVVGAIPGAGKSAAVRVLASAAALDPTVQLRLWSLKQNDFAALERVSHTFGYGLTDDVIEACLADLHAVKAEIVRRTQVLSAQPKEDCPDGKLTRELANRRDLGLCPIVMVVDECQNLFSHETHGAEAGKIAMDIIRMGRAYGVTLILCTQRPDTHSLPKGVSANASIKVCLRMTDHTGVDMVLGTGAHSRGLKAELFKQSEQGVGYLLGASDDDQVVRSFYLDALVADRIGERAHTLREAENRLTGHAVGVDADAAERKAAGVDLLDDLVEVMAGRGVDWLWNQAAVGALEVLRPDAWGGLNEASLGQLLARRGVPTKPINRKDPLDPPGSPRRNLTGFQLADVKAARSKQDGHLRAL